MAAAMTMIQLGPLRSQSLFQLSRSVMHVLYTFSCCIPTCCNQLYSIWWIWRPQLRWDKFWSLFLWQCSGIVPAWWTFQVSQGSIETLFRWGGKCSHHFAANLLGKLCTKFHQNRPSFVEDITKKHFGLFVSGHTVETELKHNTDRFLRRQSREWVHTWSQETLHSIGDHEQCQSATLRCHWSPPADAPPTARNPCVLLSTAPSHHPNSVSYTHTISVSSCW